MFGIDPTILGILWLIMSIIVAAFGAEREIGGGIAFFISLFFSPLIGIVIVYLTPSKTAIQRQENIERLLNRVNTMYSEVHNYEAEDTPGKA